MPKLSLAVLPLLCAGPVAGRDVAPPGGAGPQPEPSSLILAAYDFEAPSASGPDTFWIRQLRIHEEGLEQTVVDLRGVPNLNASPGSSVQ